MKDRIQAAEVSVVFVIAPAAVFLRSVAKEKHHAAIYPETMLLPFQMILLLIQNSPWKPVVFLLTGHLKFLQAHNLKAMNRYLHRPLPFFLQMQNQT